MNSQDVDVSCRGHIRGVIVTLFCSIIAVLLVIMVAGSSPPGAIRGAPPDAQALGGPSLRDVDGGQHYYSRFSPSLPDDPSYFPLGVWMESVVDTSDVDRDRDVGLNTYIAPLEGANLGAINASGMHYLTNWNAPGQSGTVLADEVDMWGGPGDAPWSGNYAADGNVCVPESAKCGFTIQKKFASAAAPNALKYANYGKGVTFWELNSEAVRFVNDFQDVVSADNYWFTDPGICGLSEGGAIGGDFRELSAKECRKAANYGWTVERLRSLVEPQHSKPVWALIEVGHPSDQDLAPSITTEQIRAAAWSSIIHGARGIVYFNHSFSGPCVSQHVLRDCGDALRNGIRELNRQLTELSPVLNAPFLDGAAIPGPSVDAVAKIYRHDVYVLAASTAGEPADVSIGLLCAPDGEAAVVGEGRTVRVSRGAIQDVFANADAVHIYRITGNTCGY